VTAPDDVTAHIGFSDALLVTVDAADPRAVLLNDSDPDGDQLTIVEADTPLTTALGATITFDVDGGFTYLPLDRRPASDFISYTVTDGTLTTQSTLTIDVTDAAPVVVDGAAHFHPSPANSFTYDSTIDVLSFLNLASDADGDPVNVVEAGTTVASAHGSFAVGADGFFTYQPEQSFVGVDALLVHVTDGLADPVVAGIALAVDDQPPVENAPVVLQFTNGATGNLLENATDADGDSFGAVAATIPTTNGTAIVTADGTVQWQSLTGTPEPVDETFVAELTDFWSTSEVQVTVTFPPAPPPFGCGNGPPGTPCADPFGPNFNDCACNASTPADVFTVALLALLLRRGRRNERPSA
jgi:VCBS repeat-containing protein